MLCVHRAARCGPSCSVQSGHGRTGCCTRVLRYNIMAVTVSGVNVLLTLDQ